MVAIDGNKHILGRLASHIAKRLLNGEEVYLANCESLVILGNPAATLQNYRARRALQHKGTPEFSPKWPKTPPLLVKRIIRGMVPWERTRGKEAMRRLMVVSGNPKNMELTKVPVAKFESSDAKFMTVGQLCKELGYQKR
jgi:large subunit ribosomal protein L13